MRISALRTPLLLLALSGLLMLSGCSSSKDTQSASSTINGNVSQVLSAMGVNSGPNRMAWWGPLLRLIPLAHAQGVDLSGITVTALVDGIILDTAITDATGQFTLNVPGSMLTLSFVTSTFEVTLELSVPSDSTVTLTVTLQPNDAVEPVVVEKLQAAHEPITCTTDPVVLTVNGDLTIDGGGEACIRAEGQCTVEVDAAQLTFTGCAQCLRTEGDASVNLETRGAFHCESTEDSLKTEGMSTIHLNAGGEIEITSSGANGLKTEGESAIDLVAESHVTITSLAAHGINAEGTSMVQVDAGSAMEAAAANPTPSHVQITAPQGNGIRAEGTAAVAVHATGECVIEGMSADAAVQTEGDALITACAEYGDGAFPICVANHKRSEFYR